MLQLQAWELALVTSIPSAQACLLTSFEMRSDWTASKLFSLGRKAGLKLFLVRGHWWSPWCPRWKQAQTILCRWTLLLVKGLHCVRPGPLRSNTKPVTRHYTWARSRASGEVLTLRSVTSGGRQLSSCWKPIQIHVILDARCWLRHHRAWRTATAWRSLVLVLRSKAQTSFWSAITHSRAIVIGCVDEDSLTLVEQHVWRYLQYLRESAAPPTKRSSLVEAVRFGHFALRIEGSEGILSSLRVRGLSSQLFACKRPWQPADPLTTSEAVRMHGAMNDSSQSLYMTAS